MKKELPQAVDVRVLIPGGTSGTVERPLRDGVGGVWRVAGSLYCRLETPAPGRVFVAADPGWYGGLEHFLM